ncbi:TIGR03086 family protein [Nakamurella antarctica]|uniref:TIGR03086 family protein n=1 Tax=Nakamurella antarctica TaxID=1902245 RepID=A0A3G8ZZZ9_9ACTN|nr:TIGR03086 family metal-binding protein [Nakamurella antarctica]AZI59111.1 TIGR03086 family protein [Nakamurella antarctica]
MDLTHTNLLPLLKSALGQFGARVHAVRASQWGLSTPDTEWTVRDLVNHVVSEHLWVPELLTGKRVEEVGDACDGDVLGGDPASAWDIAATASEAAWSHAGALTRQVHLSAGSVDAPIYAWQLTTDLLVHAWDLARATGGDDEFPNDLVGAVLKVVKDDGDYGAPLFAAAIPTPGCTDDLTELLALLGRDRHWTRSGTSCS